MADDEKTPLQRFVAAALDALPETRNYYDRQMQEILGTTGKPFFDLGRKGSSPKRDTLKAMSTVLGQPLELLERALDGEEVSPVTARLSREVPDQPPTRTADAGETVDIIALDLSVSMGPGTEIEDFVESEPVKFDMAMLRTITHAPPTRLRIIRGIGTSMEPTFQSNDRFLIDTTVRDLSRFDGYYWITIDGAHGLKRLRPSGDGMWRVISENPAFEDFDIDKRAVRIEGRAVWVARGL